MKTETVSATVLRADEGKILTDGKTYGKTIYLGKNRLPEEFHEITVEEYEKIQAENEPAE